MRSTVDCTSERRRSFEEEDAPLRSADESAERRRCLAAEAAPVASDEYDVIEVVIETEGERLPAGVRRRSGAHGSRELERRD